MQTACNNRLFVFQLYRSPAMNPSSAIASPLPQHPPGPSYRWFGLPLLRRTKENYLDFARELQAEHGDIVRMRIGNETIYDIHHPEMIRQVLLDKDGSFIRWDHGAKVLGKVMGRSHILLEGEEWKRRRRMIQPGFGPKRMGAYAVHMVAATNDAFDVLNGKQEQVVDFETLMTRLTMDVILRALFTHKTPNTDAPAWAVAELSRAGLKAMLSPISLPDWFPTNRKPRKAIGILNDLIWSNIRRRKAEMERGEPERDDLLGMLLAARDVEGDQGALSDDLIRDECITTFVAGHETTAAALAWWGWELATHPECAQRAAEEVDRVLDGRVPTYEDVAKLSYLTQTLKEAMRMYPPAPVFILKRTSKSVQIGPWLLPEGALVRLTPWIAQRDPRWFPNPAHFDPERFSPEGMAAQERGAYFPFGAGPRVCTGMIFAITNMVVSTAMLLQRFRLEPTDTPSIKNHVTLRPYPGLYLRLVRR
jgi:cytochrome P450